MRSLFKGKKGMDLSSLGVLPTAVILIVVAAIVAVLGLQMLGETRDDLVTDTAGCNSSVVTGCGQAYNSSLDSIEGLSDVTSKFPMIGLAIGVVIVIGIIIGVFMKFGR